ncbi:hypothetical protein EHQ12_05245 [Leptospira gomenensis]|uniref:Uncharacterized protein n=1 Tax=Leptospira gomenensis TaxID=2484974 RepID=A0A5F1YF72_9LEPT|nr:hypothetical protein [Leptospira gomenensis]TGK38425.1 hypothetical protein EHQ17_01925 [Leptospira gomenensis]TGK41993.1 hypothetical protein EHQ12_05245 [Leptospira gomenensis]TGK52239.1 hypothetical protein EHQ07_01345 [Leptospira gomenensis]TGK55774.1 hypothetical protein EHQ13_16585 [Leptospira gomenensis]
MKKLALLLILLISIDLFSEDLISFSRFRQAIPLENSPDSDFNTDGRFPKFDVLVRAVGPAIEIPNNEKWVIDSYGNSRIEKFKFSDYKYEIPLRNRKETQKIWITQSQLSELQSEINTNVQFQVSLFFYGAFKNKKRVFFLGSLKKSNAPLDQTACFSDSLMGIKLGSNYKETIDLIEDKYGPAYDTMKHRNQNAKVYIIDKDTKTVLYIYDGGEEDSDQVYSLQLSSYGNSNQELFKSVAFGDDIQVASKKLGVKLKERKQSSETDLLYSDISQCSFETKNKKIFSVFITEE